MNQNRTRYLMPDGPWHQAKKLLIKIKNTWTGKGIKSLDFWMQNFF